MYVLQPPRVFRPRGRKYGVTVAQVPFPDTGSVIAKLASGDVRPGGDQPPPPRARGRVEADHATQPRLHPKLEERLAVAAKPVLRPRLTLHHPVHGLWDRHPVANDQVTEDIAAMRQPWDIFWQSQYWLNFILDNKIATASSTSTDSSRRSPISTRSSQTAPSRSPPDLRFSPPTTSDPHPSRK